MYFRNHTVTVLFAQSINASADKYSTISGSGQRFKGIFKTPIVYNKQIPCTQGVLTMIQGLPDRLSKLRIQHGLSQKAVADRLQLSASIVSGYETGERTPSTEVLLKLTALYRCSADYLLGIEQSAPATVLDVTGLSAEQIQALQTLIDGIRHE